MNVSSMSRDDVSDGFLAAIELFNKENLQLPYIPLKERKNIKELVPDLFGTRSIDTSPYDIEAFIGEFLSKEVKNYILFGFAGYGVNSIGVHYYTVQDSFALFVQLRHGGLFLDEEIAKERINGSLSLIIAHLFEVADAAKESGFPPEGRKLLIVESDFYGSGWGWIEGCPGKIDPINWHTEEPVFLHAVNSLLAER